MLLTVLAGQMLFSYANRHRRTAIEEMPYPLDTPVLKFLSMGDDEFLFRALARWLQEVGDGGGRVRPLIEYDYDRVVGWLECLHRLNTQSDVTFEIGSHYFGAVTEPQRGPPQVRKIILYAMAQAKADPQRAWPWLVWAATRDLHFVKDRDLANQIAAQLLSLQGQPALPYWLPVLAAPLFKFSGNQAALAALAADPDWIALKLRDLREAAENMPKQK